MRTGRRKEITKKLAGKALRAVLTERANKRIALREEGGSGANLTCWQRLGPAS